MNYICVFCKRKIDFWHLCGKEEGIFYICERCQNEINKFGKE